ncbi:MAG: hypothetical protein ACFBQW_06005 [Sphingomonadaceae bacterium]
MPRHDPPTTNHVDPARLDAARAHDAWARYKKLMRWMTLAALFSVAAALAYLWIEAGRIRFHAGAAMAVGVGLSVLLGTGLMGLLFVSAHSGHDDAASGKRG